MISWHNQTKNGAASQAYRQTVFLHWLTYQSILISNVAGILSQSTTDIDGLHEIGETGGIRARPTKPGAAPARAAAGRTVVARGAGGDGRGPVVRGRPQARCGRRARRA